jgi:hypothetical protein
MRGRIIQSGQCQIVRQNMRFGNYSYVDVYYFAESIDNATFWPADNTAATRKCVGNYKYQRTDTANYQCTTGEQLRPFFLVKAKKPDAGTVTVTSTIE